MSNKIPVLLNDVEEQMLEDIAACAGYRDPEALREGLRLLYDKVVPKTYIRNKFKPPESEKPIPVRMSLEEWADSKGGEIIIKDGIKFLRTMEGAMETLSPVPKEYDNA